MWAAQYRAGLTQEILWSQGLLLPALLLVLNWIKNWVTWVHCCFYSNYQTLCSHSRPIGGSVFKMWNHCQPIRYICGFLDSSYIELPWPGTPSMACAVGTSCYSCSLNTGKRNPLHCDVQTAGTPALTAYDWRAVEVKFFSAKSVTDCICEQLPELCDPPCFYMNRNKKTTQF